jgi:hypothetical protein
MAGHDPAIQPLCMQKHWITGSGPVMTKGARAKQPSLVLRQDKAWIASFALAMTG